MKQNKAILKGQIYTPIEVKLRVSSVLLRYHAGYACFSQAKHGDDISSGQEVLVYDLQKIKHPMVFTCGGCSTIISATLGGGQQSGVQLVYCEVDEKVGARLVCPTSTSWVILTLLVSPATNFLMENKDGE